MHCYLYLFSRIDELHNCVLLLIYVHIYIFRSEPIFLPASLRAYECLFTFNSLFFFLSWQLQAELYRVRKAFKKAEPLYLEAIDILEESFGPEDIRYNLNFHFLFVSSARIFTSLRKIGTFISSEAFYFIPVHLQANECKCQVRIKVETSRLKR